MEVFTFQWGLSSRLPLTFWPGRWFLRGRLAGRAPWAPFLLSGVLFGVCGRARAVACPGPSGGAGGNGYQAGRWMRAR